MVWFDNAATYGLISKFFHWAMAIIIIALLAIGLYMADLSLSPQKLTLYSFHKSFGFLILVLVTLRILWRLRNPYVPSLITIPRWQEATARAVHFCFYMLMITMPIIGWLMSSAAGFSVSVFGLFKLPDLIQPSPLWRERLEGLHNYGGYLFIVLIGAHISAALYHHFIKRDNILKRIVPW